MIDKFTTLGKVSIISTLLLIASCGNSSDSSSNSTETKTTATVSTPEAEETNSDSPAKVVEQVEATPEDLGKKVYARCRTCHTLEEGGRHRVGPNLWGIFGKTSGTAEGFAYSKAMKEAALVWDEQSISEYMENPKGFIPGNKMVFIGLKKQADRDNLIAYLKAETQSQ